MKQKEIIDQIISENNCIINNNGETESYCLNNSCPILKECHNNIHNISMRSKNYTTVKNIAKKYKIKNILDSIDKK